MDADVIARSVSLYHRDTEAKKLIDLFANNDIKDDTSAQDAASMLGIEQHEVRDLFKKLDSAGLGNFKVGRRGYETRFVWLYEPNTIRQAVIYSKINGSEMGLRDTEANNIGLLGHVMRLRPNLQVNVSLPIDLSKSEADRLADWIKTLPFS